MVLRQLWHDANELAQAAYGGKDAKRLMRAILATDSYQITALQRIRMSAIRWGIPGANHFLRMVQTTVHGIEIGKDVILGDGVYFNHPLGIVIGGNSRIGDRVRFFGNNTVGTAREDGYPTIEDDVWVGAGARILGPVRVGARSTVGANAVVITDVPPDCIAVGIPAKVKRKPPPRYGCIRRS
ncbi:MAG: serine acetyltransferase [Deltaproteobacteria bacterium RIFOXYA12_FULL_58_15]|nr:MAG: serine acetyltransferase [Deltaproteobacteria bacterium RIFOXYA12_FULL_58_15]OGR14877.1 MAG: serine acetyltransferase [Deltaproteobacteria bacterium RIFOXYB12_FULL_58_9]